jgi:hypothetical protein
MKLMNGPKAGIVRRRCCFLWLAVLAIALHPAAALSSGQKQPAIQQLCGQDLEVVWEKAIAGNPRKERLDFHVYPAGKNYWVEVNWLSNDPSAGEPVYTRNMLIDPKGDKIWQRDTGYLDIPYPIAGRPTVMVGDKLYKYDGRILTPFEKSLRYHVWLDAEGYILSVHAQRVDWLPWAVGEPEAGDGLAYNIEPGCSRDGFCSVDRLTVTEKGIDPKGWETLVRWPYPAGSEEGTVYSAVKAGSSYLLIHKMEPKTSDSEWRLITFAPSGDGRIISESTYLLPRISSSTFMKNRKGDFVFFDFEDGGTYTVMRLDESGRLIEKRSYRLPRTFHTFLGLIRQFRDGWVIESRTFSDVLRVSSDGSPLWLHRLPGEDDRLAGNGEDTLFFQLGDKLCMCRERQAPKK